MSGSDLKNEFTCVSELQISQRSRTTCVIKRGPIVSLLTLGKRKQTGSSNSSKASLKTNYTFQSNTKTELNKNDNQSEMSDFYLDDNDNISEISEFCFDQSFESSKDNNNEYINDSFSDNSKLILDKDEDINKIEHEFICS